ncbi:hypothetical protein [Sphingopyxis sp. SCN 67-31]|uniref:hypothetical protein n=1 Tax=Sphingopyxis sp. SCN 67-31 TaxID=1660142 RepID=UPI00086E2868|nr:hypothetical protein [Sphingopyxis sp. SCN 67-31]ODU28989.1 MAG: hypothetical protein ABS88_10690 [Sphingopyxis sp. SCN 67-31]
MSARAIIRPFMPSDLLGFAVQPAQRSETAADPGAVAVDLICACAAPVSAECADGRVRLVGGIVGDAWATVLVALFAEDAGPWMLPIVRAVRGWLAEQPAHRIAMDVREDFDAGHRFAKLLGFEAEGLMRAYGPNRENHMLYARIAAGGAA